MPDDFEEYYNKNRHLLPPEIAEVLDKGYDTLYFAFDIWAYLNKVLPPKFHALMLEQYPVMKKHDHPILLDYMNDINEATMYGIATGINNLRLDDKNKVDLRKKYPKFEKWRKFYGSPPHPKKTTDKDRQYYSHLNDEEWIQFKQNEDAVYVEFFNWEEKRKTEFYDVVQPVLLNKYEWMQTFEPDTWIMYAVRIRDEYEDWKAECERVEEILDYNLSYECINQNISDYMPLLSKVYASAEYEETNLRNRRIAGENI